MRRSRLATSIFEPCRFLLAAVVVGALISAQAVSAESLLSARRVDAAPHRCKCGSNCGDSCCCGPGETQTRRPAPEPISAPDRAGTSTCTMKSAPCGVPMLPSASSGHRVSEIAALHTFGHLWQKTTGALLMFTPQFFLPSRRASRLDRPPERLFSA